MAKILRQKFMYGPRGKFGVSRTTFLSNFVGGPGRPKFIKGTTVARLQPVRLGERAIGFIESEADEVIENLKRERRRAEVQ